MNRRTVLLGGAAMVMLGAVPALAVRPDEVLSDPALEARARALSSQLRCMVCQNQSIDDSDADLARDLRILVRDRLRAGDSDAQVMQFVVARYGEFVLLKPPFSIRNALLWAMPAGVLLFGGGFAWAALRSRPKAGQAPLSTEEERALDALLDRPDPSG
jgi:cytochrome c-type biogenesis protein CcmH